MNESRALAITALLVFILALSLRLAHLYALRSAFAGTELFSIPRVDAAHHWNEALEILGNRFRLPDRVPWKGPGYSYFLAASAALVGRSPGNLRWVVAVLGALNCGLLVVLARRWLELRWSLLAGVLAAVNGVLIIFDTELYQPTLLVTLGLAMFFLLGRRNAATAAHAGAGAFLGLSVLVHPGYLLSGVLLAVWVARRNPRHAAALLLTMGAAVAPVTLTNLVVHGQPVLVSWNGGVNLYVANSPTFDQYAGNGSMAWGRVVKAPADLGMESESERDRLYYALAARRAASYPLATLRILLLKTWIFFSPVEYASNIRLYELREYSPVAAATLGRWGPFWIPFGLWGPLALIGLVSSLRRRLPFALPVALWSLGVLLTNVLFFNTARYRAPAVFFGCIFATVACSEVWAAWRQRDHARLLAGACLYAGAVVLLAATAVPQTMLPPPLEWFQAEAVTPRNGTFEEAHRWAEEALARDPDSASLLGLVATLHGKWGRPDLQRKYLRRLIELEDLEPDSIDFAHQQAAESYTKQGRFEEARREYMAAIDVGADDSEWRGYPHYPLGLPPVRACLLRLELADVEILAGNREAASALADRVSRDCPATGGIGRRLERLRSWLETAPS